MLVAFSSVSAHQEPVCIHMHARKAFKCNYELALLAHGSLPNHQIIPNKTHFYLLVYEMKHQSLPTSIKPESEMNQSFLILCSPLLGGISLFGESESSEPNLTNYYSSTISKVKLYSSGAIGLGDDGPVIRCSSKFQKLLFSCPCQSNNQRPY